MSSMESFYGGRQGASFTIVKRFDCIKINENDKYKKIAYAVKRGEPDKLIRESANGSLITRSGQTYDSYTEWEIITFDGSPKTYATCYQDNNDNWIDDADVTFDQLVEKEDMVSFFQQGGSTTSAVNYGEYVLIDTITDGLDYDNPDNGKVFRRGVDYQSEDGGAEYIGQIVGPKGDAPDIKLKSYQAGQEPSGAWTVNNSSLVPGGDGTTFNDDIKYQYKYKKENGKGVVDVGLQIPYLVNDFDADSVNPWDEEPVLEPDDTLTDHPFYKKWHFHIPKGIKGDSITNIGIKCILPAGSPCSFGEPIKEGETLEDIEFSYEDYPQTNPFELQGDVVSGGITYSDQIFTTNTANLVLECYYIQTVYDNGTQEGVSTEHSFGIPYIEDIDINTGAVEGEGSQRVVVKFNGQPSKEIGNPLNYIIESVIVNSGNNNTIYGHLLVKYSDENKRGHVSYNGYDYWVDLGDVKGETGGLAILTHYSAGTPVPTQPPEVLGGSSEYRGWMITIEDSNGEEILYAWDYNNTGWFVVGSLAQMSLDPEDVFVIADSAPSVKPNGIWAKIATRIYAE